MQIRKTGMIKYLLTPRKKKNLILYIVASISGLALLHFMFGYEISKSKELGVNFGQHYHADIGNTVPGMGRIDKKQKILLFLCIFSAPVRNDRRNAIRETWMIKCKMNKNVVCLFLTDRQDVRGLPLQGEIKEKLDNESRHYKDVIFANSPGGLNFGRRLLWMYEWATQRYDFQYVLRMDDDYFLCFDKLVNELQHHRPKKLFIWGWLHCRRKGIIKSKSLNPLIRNYAVHLKFSVRNCVCEMREVSCEQLNCLTFFAFAVSCAHFYSLTNRIFFSKEKEFRDQCNTSGDCRNVWGITFFG